MIEELYPDLPRTLADFMDEKNIADFVEKKGILEAVLKERDFATALAFYQLQKVDKYLTKNKKLPFVQRGEIAKTYNELKEHVEQLDTALSYYALLSGIIECNKNPKEGVDYAVVLNISPKNQKDLYDDALQNIGKAQEVALQAEKKNDELINKLATLCPGIGSPYQLKLKPNKHG